MAKKDKLEAVKAAIIENTAEWDKEVYTIEDKRTEKGKELSDLCSDMSFSKQDKERLAKVLSVLSGEKVKLNTEEEFKFAALTALIVLKVDEKHKHTYETGTLVISLGDGTAVDQNGKTGSPIQPTREVVRPATEEEIEKHLSVGQLTGLMKEVNLVFA
jgi:chromosome segregation ATPase